MQPYTERCIELIKEVPVGKVATYGQIAIMAGNNRGARQVARILHTMTKKYELPWHRIVNSKGQIVVKGDHLYVQKELLESEGVKVGANGKIDLKKYCL